jgi:hypothetical protein
MKILAPQPATTQRERVLTALQRLTTPPSFFSVWIGPFDQLASAGYALLKAEEMGYHDRLISMYYPRVHKQTVGLLTEIYSGKPSSDRIALSNFLSGVYFHAAIQRTTFGAERLVATFATGDCTCGRPTTLIAQGKTWPNFGKYREAANSRLGHSHFAGTMAKFRAMLQQLVGWKGGTVDPAKALAILRTEVNKRKHAPYLRAQAQASMPTGPTGERWSSAQQLEIATIAFESACGAYEELVQWNPGATG